MVELLIMLANKLPVEILFVNIPSVLLMVEVLTTLANNLPVEILFVEILFVNTLDVKRLLN